MATDILTSSVTSATATHRHFAPALAISDLNLRDDRYPLISPPHHIPQPIQQLPPPSVNIISPSTSFYPNAVHQAVRGPSLPSFDLPSHSMNMSPASLRSPSPQPEFPTIHDERRPVHHPDSSSTRLDADSPNSYPIDHVQPTNSPASQNMQLFGPSQTSQASSGDAGKPPPTGDVHLSSRLPRPLQLVPPRQTSPQRSQSPELYSPTPRSGVAVSQGQAMPLPGSPLSQGMRISTMTQYNPAIPVTVSPVPRVQAQQPTYITPTTAPNPINPVFTTQPLRPEEICVECAMRDQDMADVDVASPGVWARHSDVYFEDLLRRELEEESIGVPCQDPQRPRARGGRLTEANLKLWLSLNPKEPASKGEALERYVKAQRTLVEAEALAHARALRESRQLEDRMRDTYSQLRRSAYELGVATSSDDRGVRIKTQRSSILPLSNQTNGQNREITVLENGMIVEHVDVRKEEREERQQRRRGEKRARGRKSSRGSFIEVASVNSTTSPFPHTDSGFPLFGSRSSTSRPISVLTSPMEAFPRGTQSNASLEALSMVSAGAASPNRPTRFFGMRNLSTGFRSSDSLAPSGFSGSMVDMHVALQHGGERLTHSLVESADKYHTWQDSSALLSQPESEQKPGGKPKKRKGLAKLWQLVTGTPKNAATPPHNVSQRRDRVRDDDDLLTPPPPLSYLVSRGTGDNAASALRHVSTPSLPSTSSPPNFPLSPTGMSPPTAPSSLLPSPTSSRPVGVAPEFSESRKAPLVDADGEQPPSPPQEEPLQALAPQRGVYPTTSEPDLRHRVSQGSNTPVPPIPRVPTSTSHTTTPPSSGWRDKVLPPLPGEVQLRPPIHAQTELRPRTLFSYDMREINGGRLTAPQAPFASPERRRQSFNGLSNSPSSLVVQTIPTQRPGFDPEKYGEFGASRNALVSSSLPMHRPPKRKSKFGFATFLGRKFSTPVPDSEPVEFPLGRSSVSEARDEAELGMHYDAGQGHVFPRMSMSLTARKNIETLVDQSPDFVAYRYPSGDQNLSLLR